MRIYMMVYYYTILFNQCYICYIKQTNHANFTGSSTGLDPLCMTLAYSFQLYG
jgi:hypothetical protein